MKKWYVPVTLMSLGGLGILLLTDGGRRFLRTLLERIYAAPDRFLEWNEVAQRELDRIQAALNRVAESLDTAR